MSDSKPIRLIDSLNAPVTDATPWCDSRHKAVAKMKESYPTQELPRSPEPTPDLSGLLTASVITGRDHAAGEQPVACNVQVKNHGDSPVTVAAVIISTTPRHGSMHAAQLDYLGGHVPPPMVGPHGEAFLPFSVAFMPIFGMERHYTVSAQVRFESGATVDAESAVITVNPIG